MLGGVGGVVMVDRGKLVGGGRRVMIRGEGSVGVCLLADGGDDRSQNRKGRWVRRNEVSGGVCSTVMSFNQGRVTQG